MTAYYFGFFSVSIFNRLIGQPIIFLSSEQLNIIKSIGVHGSSLGQGAYKIQITKSLSATRSEITFKQRGKPHEANWNEAFNLIASLLRSKSISPTAEEAAFWSTLFKESFGVAWPSIVRNKYNYSPGYGYSLETSRTPVAKFLEHYDSDNFDGVIKKLILYSEEASRSFDIKDNKIQLVLATSLGMYGVVCSLYSELRRRRFMDSRWSVGRAKYMNDKFCSLRQRGVFRLAELVM